MTGVTGPVRLDRSWRGPDRIRRTDHLRETGWNVSIVDTADAPAPLSTKDTWRGLKDDAGSVAAYGITVDDRLADTLAGVWSRPSVETRTALEITGTATHPTVAAACAFRTDERPGAKAPLPGLTPQRGRHRAALNALNPLSVNRLEAKPATLPDGSLEQLRWTVNQANFTRSEAKL